MWRLNTIYIYKCYGPFSGRSILDDADAIVDDAEAMTSKIIANELNNLVANSKIKERLTEILLT